jgi:hypothetical protein
MSAIERELLVELPFDQYQPYRVAADLVGRLEIPASGTVVDVGGGPGLVEAFFPDHEVAAVGSDELSSPLPFADRSFAVGLALDTLEHLGREARTPFLMELRRVCDVIVLSAPFATPAVALAENALCEFALERLGASVPSRPASAEHRLPDLEATVSAMEAEEWATATLPSGYLPRWLVGMVLRHELLASGLGELPRLNTFYNTIVGPYDCREPAYRHVLLAARELPAERLASAVDSLRSSVDDAPGEAAAEVASAALLAHGLTGIAASGARAALQFEVARLSAEMAELRTQNTQLHEDLQMARDATIREARRSISSVALQRASDWRARRQER